LFIRLAHSIAADFGFTGRAATIAGNIVAVVALFTEAGVKNAIAAPLFHAKFTTAITGDFVAVITFFPCLELAVSALFQLTGGAAAITGNIISIVAVFTQSRLKYAVSAVLLLAGRRASIAGYLVSIIAEFSKGGLEYSVSAHLQTAG
jgi:tetrahydromethanopterin S-methyltransferase subunit E